MHLINNTSISNELIKSILINAGYDVTACNELEINYMIDNDNDNGECGMYTDGTTYINIIKGAATSTLAHELKHAMQFQVLGEDDFYSIYEVESEMDGYANNILELDAVEFSLKYA